MDMEEIHNLPDRPVSAVDGTWPIEDWPLDVQRVDENGIDLSLVERALRLTPEERVEQNYRERLLGAELRRAGERLYGSALPNLEEIDRL
jgi:hypothetical protein